jgi:tRNA A-37 threonylcarbamoyl transferase component Bud32
MSSVVFNPEQWGVELGHVHHSESNHSYVAFDTSAAGGGHRHNNTIATDSAVHHSLDFGGNTLSGGHRAGLSRDSPGGFPKDAAGGKHHAATLKGQQAEPNPADGGGGPGLFVVEREDSYYRHMEARRQQIAKAEVVAPASVPGTIDPQQHQCAISMDASNCRVFPCMHHFKASEAFRWIVDNRTCPVCRADVDDMLPLHSWWLHSKPAVSGDLLCELVTEPEVAALKNGWMMDCEVENPPPPSSMESPGLAQAGGVRVALPVAQLPSSAEEGPCGVHAHKRKKSFADTYDMQMVGGSCSELLGRGSFAEVLKGTNKHTGLPVAVKVIGEKMLATEGVAAAVKQEAKLQRKVQRTSNHVAKVLDDFHEDKKVFIVMEYANCGTLEERLSAENARYQPMKASVAKHFIRHILRALDTSHKHGVVHADVKPENVLLFHPDYAMQRDAFHTSMHNTEIDVEVVAKLCDFGTSQEMPEGQDALSFTQELGTYGYMAPELLKASAYGCPADVWGAGCILYRMLVGYGPPWYPYSACVDEPVEFDDRDWDEVENGAGAMDLIARMLTADPSQRSTCEEALAHPFLV